MVILVLLAAAAQAAAQPVPAPPPSLDTEAGMPHRAPRQQVFVAPSGEPFRAAPDVPYPVADWFARANTMHDGKLTQAQFTADFVRFVASLDLNHDGVIDGAELQAYETKVLPETHPPAFGDGRGGGQGKGDQGAGQGEGGGGGHGHHGGSWGSGGGDAGADRPKGAGRFGLLPLPEPVAAMDTDLDGRISQQEVLAAAAARFAQLDTGNRGYLMLNDLPKTWMQSRREMFRKWREEGGGGNWGRGGGRGGGMGDAGRGGSGGMGDGGSGGMGGGTGSEDQGN